MTELVRLDGSSDGLDAHLRGAGRDTRLAAAYVIAADGPHSPVRESLGITRSTNGFTGSPSVSVDFTAALVDVVRGREFNLCGITHPDIPGGLASVDGRRRWVFASPGADTGRDWPRLLRQALGVPVPDLEIMSVLAWRSEMFVADAYRAGRVLLAGDAAHVMPPFAASGANTGIADAHNAAWKLAAVLGVGPAGRAHDALLDTYDSERRPAGWFAADQSTRRTRQIQDRATADPTLAHRYVLAASGGPQYLDGALAGHRARTRTRSRSPSSRRGGGSAPGSRTAGSTPAAPGRRSTWPARAGPSSDPDMPPSTPALRPTRSTSWRSASSPCCAPTTSSPGAAPAPGPTPRSTPAPGGKHLHSTAV